MAKTEKYFIGPQLLGEIRETVTRVAGMPDRTSGVSLPVRLQELRRPGSGGGGVSLRLGRVTAAWNKSTLQSVVEYGSGEALSEEFAAPPVIIENCVNKFANVESGAWVLVGRAHGRWYLVSAECEVPDPEEETPPE